MNGTIRGVAAPLGLLLLFGLVIRGLPPLVRPASPPDDCERVAPADAPALRRCLALRPDDIELMIDLAAVYERAGQRDRAGALYARALAIDPSDAEVRLKLRAIQSEPPPNP